MKKITFIFTLLVGLFSQAQWVTDTAVNTLVADSDSGDMKAITTSDGQTYIMFWKSIASPENYELRLQLLDANGNQQFGTDGMLVSNSIPMSTYTVASEITVDSSNNIYIGVTGTDYDTTLSSYDIGYAFKIDSNGSQLWGANGVNTNGVGFSVQFLPLSTGETILTWSTNTQSFIQKYDASGTAVWTSPTAVIGANGKTSPADLYEMANGDILNVFHQRGNFGISSTLYAQRYNNNGVAQWANPTQLSDKTTRWNSYYSGTIDGDTVYYGYFASTGTRFDSFLQKINADGSLPWGINGADFDTNTTNYEKDTKIAYSPGSNYIWAVCNYTDQGQNNNGEYVQKFDKATGARQFTDTAKEVFAIGGSRVHSDNLQLINDQPLFLVEDGVNNGAAATTLNVCYLDANGDFVWTGEIKPVATFSASKNRTQFSKPANGSVIAIFTEDKGSGEKIYAQNFTDLSFSIDDFNATTTLHYVNPIQNELKLESNEQIQTISIHNVLGQSIVNQSVNSTQVTIDSQLWETGMYFVNVSTVNGNKKVIQILKD